ncbi:MAG: mannosyltransferase family protein, partial [Chloroflexota bacterium]
MKSYKWILLPIMAFVVSRLLIFCVGMIGDSSLPTEAGYWDANPNMPFISMWAKWDSQYYVDIAENGYWYRPEQQSNVAFFPLYPLLMRLTARVVGDVALAGFLLSNVAFLGVLLFLYKLTELELDSDSAKRSVFYLALFPSSFFFSSVYPESLFLLLALATMYFARRHMWIWASLIGMFASATQNLGVLLWLLVMWEWLRVQGWSLKTLHKKLSWINLMIGFRQHWFDLFIIAIIPLGLIAYVYFLQRNFERPLAFLETQLAWGRQNVGPVS